MASKKKEKKEPKKELKEGTPDIVVAHEADLSEVVTEVVTKLLAEDILEMNDDRVIDVKQPSKKKKKTDD
jgi:hypothetical protein